MNCSHQVDFCPFRGPDAPLALRHPTTSPEKLAPTCSIAIPNSRATRPLLPTLSKRDSQEICDLARRLKLGERFLYAFGATANKFVMG